MPERARSVKSIVYFLSASRFDSASESFTCSPPRTSSTACSNATFDRPCIFNNLPAVPLSSASANRNISLAIKASPRLSANLSVTFSKLFKSRETETSPELSEDFGKLSIAVVSAILSGVKCAPARANNEDVPPSSWLINAEIKCNASIVGLSFATAKLCASLRACWNFVVNLSKRIFHSVRVDLDLRWG